MSKFDLHAFFAFFFFKIEIKQNICLKRKEMTDINIDLNCLKSIGSELCRVFWRQLRRCHSLAGSLQLLPRIHRRVDNLHWVRAAASRLQSLFRYFRQGGVATEVRHDLLPGNYENPEREVHKWRELGKIQQSCASKFGGLWSQSSWEILKTLNWEGESEPCHESMRSICWG